MITRTGKIAQLPKTLRDQLNQRLDNGQQSPELLKWLNGLSKTKKLLAKKFANQPITKSNLSDWRHGGFQEWRADQAREARIQRISESGDSLHRAETGDLFENFARIAVAELMADMDCLHKLRNEKRSQYLHNLVRDLARLQSSYNRSRWAELAWTKYNDSKPIYDETPNPETVSPASSGDLTASSPTPVVPDGGQSCGGALHDSEPKKPYDPFNHIYHTRCSCGDPCPKCHAPDSAYPLDEVLRDEQFYRENGARNPCDRHGRQRYLIHYNCDCFCERCAEKAAASLAPVARAFPPAGSGDFPVPSPDPSTSPDQISTINSDPEPLIGPINPLSPVELADFSRQMALLKSTRQQKNHDLQHALQSLKI